MLKVEDYEWYTLMEIEQEGDDDLQSQILYLRQQEMQSWGTNRLQRHILLEHHQCSLVELDKILTQSVLLHTSTSLFPEQEVVLYPQFAERVATKSFICDVSGAIISKGSYYICYQAFFDNLTNGRRYVLKRPLISELGSEHFFPTTISEMDDLDEHLKTAYEYPFVSEYDYYDIARRIGEGVPIRQLGISHSSRQKIKKR